MDRHRADNIYKLYFEALYLVLDRGNTVNPFSITLTGYILKSDRTHTSDLSNGIGGLRSCVSTHTESADGLVFAKKHALYIHVMLITLHDDSYDYHHNTNKH